MAMLGHTDLRKDTLIELDGELYRVVDYSHAAMGRGGAVARVKVKNLLTGALVEKTFRAADKIQSAELERAALQYLYREGNQYYFMDQTSFEQEAIDASKLGEQVNYLADGATVTLLKFQDRVVGIDLPNTVYMKVTECEPGARGDTVTAALKACTLETGLKTQVPLFIQVGDSIKVDTRTGQYLERAK